MLLARFDSADNLICFCKILHILVIESTILYVGLARAVSRLTFLLPRLQEALYEDLAV